MRDCNDFNALVHPGAPERCDGLDNDCDGVLPTTELDFDADGLRSCEGDCDDTDATLQLDDADGDGVSTCSGDCDDSDPLRFPGAGELCDGLDTNCDGRVGLEEIDADFDGELQCAGDCDDRDPFVSQLDYDGDGFAGCDAIPDCDDLRPEVHPGAVEVCNGLDDDCDGTVDGPDPIDALLLYEDLDGDGYGAGSAVVSCWLTAPLVANGTDCNDYEATQHPAATELCDGVDNDCNGLDDDGLPVSRWYADGDGDGFGDANSFVEACLAPPGWVGDDRDCDDTDPDIWPGAPEWCDLVDQDCDGLFDDNALDGAEWTGDGDGDGDGGDGPAVWACTPPPGYGWPRADCDDTDPAVFSGAPELCDGLDNDCDGVVDEEAIDRELVFPDSDGDGFGSIVPASELCAPGPGWAALDGDCDDTDSTSFPGATDLCNDGVDQDCDGADRSCPFCGDGLCNGTETGETCCSDCDGLFTIFLSNDHSSCEVPTQYDTPDAGISCNLCAGDTSCDDNVPVPWGATAQVVQLDHGECVRLSIANSSRCWHGDAPANTVTYWDACYDVSDCTATWCFGRCTLGREYTHDLTCLP